MVAQEKSLLGVKGKRYKNNERDRLEKESTRESEEEY